MEVFTYSRPSISAAFHPIPLCLILAVSFISRFCSCNMEFCKSALPAGKTVLMFSHENTFPTPGAISFGSNNFVLSFWFVKLVYLDLSFFRISYFFIYHYLLPLPLLSSAAAACLAFSFVAFSSSITFFLSSFDIFRNITYLGSCCCAFSKEV